MYIFRALVTLILPFLAQNLQIKIVSISIAKSAVYPRKPCTVMGIFLDPIIIKVVDAISKQTAVVKKIKTLMAMKACERLIHAGFDTVDIDLIFAIPSQEVKEAENDIYLAGKLGADQISTYPLIPFSYTPIKAYLQETGLTLPSWRLERQMLKTIVKKAQNAGYKRTSIWSFNQPESVRYTTVTRDSFIGIGAGASSRIGDYFWLNTFSVVDYIRTIADGQSPLALATRLNAGDKMAYWLFWQCYNTAINTDTFQSMFGKDLPHRIKAFLSLLGPLGLADREGTAIRLNDAGAYLFHLVEKGYTHAYLETLWKACLQEAWPRRLVL